MKSISRRKFLGNSTLTAGLAPFALSSLSSPFIGSAAAAEPGPNQKVRLGVIGCGGMGRGDLECFFLNPEVDCAVVCDIDDAMLAKAVEICEKKRNHKPDTVKDFRRVLDRKDVDIVLIATPEHGHALPTVMASQAGKDVYVEKPLAKTIDEGRAMLAASRRHNRVVQMGSQWRSCKHIREAGDFIRSGKLGKVSLVRGWAYLDWLAAIGKPADCAPPPGVDYDMWLGPAPKRAFNPNRFHFNFRWFWQYAGGLMTDWGVHLIQVLLWAMGSELPKAVMSSGGKYVLVDNSETPDTQIAVYEFPTYTLVWEHKVGVGLGLYNRPWGMSFTGTEGTLVINDSGWEILREPSKDTLEAKKYPGGVDPRPAHVRNFLDCVKSRQQPVENLEVGHFISTVAHLGNIALRSGHRISWDPKSEKIAGDPAADRLVGVGYRKPWKLPYSRRI